MTKESLTANQWPGPPRELMPLLEPVDREWRYSVASADDASLEELGVVWQDINQRYAAALGAK